MKVRYIEQVCLVIIGFMLLPLSRQAASAQTCPLFTTYGYGNSRDDFSLAQVMDAKGNLYFTGQQHGKMITAKFSPSGDILWTNTVSGKKGGTGRDIKIDKAGNIYVSGYVTDSLNSHGLKVIKYDNDGSVLWSNTFPDTTELFWHFPLALDNEDNVYAATAANNGNLHIFKYSSAGELLWVRREIPASGRHGWLNRTSIRTDHNGNLYVAGGMRPGADFNDGNFTVLKYSPEGDLLWKREDEGTMNYMDYANDIEVDHHGNVYATGLMNYIGEHCNTVTMKYDANGNLLWKNVHDNSSNDGDEPFDLYLASDGGVYVTGAEDHHSIYGSSPYLGITIKYDEDGNLVWKRLLGDTLKRLVAKKIGEDTKGNIYLSGHFVERIPPYYSRYGTFAASLDAGGNINWLDTCYSYGSSFLGALSVHSTGIYIVAAQEEENNTISIGVFRYAANVTAAADPVADSEGFSIYPNPASEICKLDLDVAYDMCVEVADAQGRKIYCRNIPGGTKPVIDVSGFAPGIYIIRAVANDKVFTKRMIVSHD